MVIAAQINGPEKKTLFFLNKYNQIFIIKIKAQKKTTIIRATA